MTWWRVELWKKGKNCRTPQIFCSKDNKHPAPEIAFQTELGTWMDSGHPLSSHKHTKLARLHFSDQVGWLSHKKRARARVSQSHYQVHSRAECATRFLNI